MRTWLRAVWHAVRRLWRPVVTISDIPLPLGADEDRGRVEDEKQEFAEELHDMRRRVHFLEVAAKVRQRKKDAQ